jgi:hypothetical protein
VVVEPVIRHAKLGQRLGGDRWFGEQDEEIVLGSDPAVIEPTRLVGRTA